MHSDAWIPHWRICPIPRPATFYQIVLQLCSIAAANTKPSHRGETAALSFVFLSPAPYESPAATLLWQRCVCGVHPLILVFWVQNYADLENKTLIWTRAPWPTLLLLHRRLTQCPKSWDCDKLARRIGTFMTNLKVAVFYQIFSIVFTQRVKTGQKWSLNCVAHFFGIFAFNGPISLLFYDSALGYYQALRGLSNKHSSRVSLFCNLVDLGVCPSPFSGICSMNM